MNLPNLFSIILTEIIAGCGLYKSGYTKGNDLSKKEIKGLRVEKTNLEENTERKK